MAACGGHSRHRDRGCSVVRRAGRQQWYTRLAIARILIETLENLDLHVPQLTHRERREINEARRRLRAKKR